MKKLRLPVLVTLLIGLLLMLSNGFNVGGLHTVSLDTYQHHHAHEQPISPLRGEVHTHVCCSEEHQQQHQHCRAAHAGLFSKLAAMFDYGDTHAELHDHCRGHCHVSLVFSVFLALDLQHGQFTHFYRSHDQAPLMWVANWPQINHSDTFRPPCA